MRRLILMRHAKTEARAPGGSDFDRRLTERGRADAALMGQVLADAGMTPDLALISPASRARETWALAATAFPRARAAFCRELYDAAPEEVVETIRQGAGPAGTVIVVGHNPSLHELAIELADESEPPSAEAERLAAGFPTAAAAVFAVGPDGAHRLEALLRASEHRATRPVG